MKVLRRRIWPWPIIEGVMTQWMVEEDLNLSIEEARQSLREAAGDAFVSDTIFEMSEGSSMECVTHAIDELDAVNELLENNMAILFHYTASMLDKVGSGPDVFLCSKRRAPFNIGYMTDVLKQLRRHSKYKGQTIVAVDHDGNAIAMRNGDVRILSKDVGIEIESFKTSGIPSKDQLPFRIRQKIDKAFEER